MAPRMVGVYGYRSKCMFSKLPVCLPATTMTNLRVRVFDRAREEASQGCDNCQQYCCRGLII